MKGSGRNISLTSYDDLFSTEETRQADAREQIQQIPLSELHPFKDHPFRVVDDDRMMETVESVKEYGVLVPAIARPLEDGGYEIVAGHRRKRACELAGLDTIYGRHSYRIFAVLNMKVSDWDPAAASFGSGKAFLQFVNRAKQKALYSTGVEVKENDHILTLITCDRSYGGASGRLIVMAIQE